MSESDDKLQQTWDKMRQRERQERDQDIVQDLEQVERISKTIAGESEPEG